MDRPTNENHANAKGKKISLHIKIFDNKLYDLN